MTSSKRSDLLGALLLLGAVVLGLKVRLVQLDTGLGQDELFSAVNFVEAGSVWTTISRNDAFNNHIGYSLMARASEAAFGRSERALRLPALLSGLLGILALFVLTRSILGERLALLSAYLLALSPPHIEASVSARGYATMFLLTTIASRLYLRLLRSPGRGVAAAFVAVSAFGIYTHLYASMVTAVQVLFLGYLAVVRRGGARRSPLDDREHRRLLVVCFLAIAGLTLLLYLPALRPMLRDLAGRGRGAFEPGFPWEIARELAGTDRPLLVGLAILVAAIGFVDLRRTEPTATDYFCGLIALPLAVMWLLVRPFDLYARFFVYWLPYALLLFVAGLRALWRPGLGWSPRTMLFRAGAAGVFAAFLSSWTLAAQRLIPDEGYREASRRVLAGAGPSAAICAVGGARSVWRYYIDRPILNPRSIAEFEAMARTHPEVRCAYFRARWQNADQTELARFLFEHATAARVNDDLTVFVYPGKVVGPQSSGAPDP